MTIIFHTAKICFFIKTQKFEVKIKKDFSLVIPEQETLIKQWFTC